MRRTITSRHNSLLQLTRSVRDGKSDELIYVEGLRLCEEAVRSRLEIKAVIYSSEIAEKPRAATFLKEVEPLLPQLNAVSENLLASVSYTKTPQGIILLARRPATEAKALEPQLGTQPLVVVLHGINNPVMLAPYFAAQKVPALRESLPQQIQPIPFRQSRYAGQWGLRFGFQSGWGLHLIRQSSGVERATSNQFPPFRGQK
jgi:hypothetical protein